MLKVLTVAENEDFLRRVSKKVDFDELDLKQNIAEIKEWCLANNSVYAMAAIQFGIDKRIVFVKSTTENVAFDKNAQEMMINPEIISQEGKTEFWESCASGGLNFALVERPYKMVVRYQDENAVFYTKTFEGFSATVVSHELDHLDGIFHMDRAKELLQLPQNERVEYRKNHPYKIISKSGIFEYPEINNYNEK